MKKIFAFILLIMLFILIFLIQTIVLNNIKFFGINSNLLLVTVIMISLWYNTYLSNIFAILTGIIADIFFSFTIGKSAIIYLVISIVITLIAKVYKKDNNLVIISVMILGVIIFEVAMVVVNFGMGLNNISLWQFIKIVIKSSTLNISLAYIVRRLLQKYTIKINQTLDMYLER